jgi:hypothetical protein
MESCGEQRFGLFPPNEKKFIGVLGCQSNFSLGEALLLSLPFHMW